jgi:hypothetical protein
MSTSAFAQTAAVESRVVDEGYGPGAWHGPDLKAALADVDPGLAFWRPGPKRHNIAEIALHHAYCVRGVRSNISGVRPEPFPLAGDDWFDLPGESALPWHEIQSIVETEQRALASLVADVAAGRNQSPKTDRERFDLVLGISCHAVYHAGQVQLIKKLRAGE